MVKKRSSQGVVVKTGFLSATQAENAKKLAKLEQALEAEEEEADPEGSPEEGGSSSLPEAAAEAPAAAAAGGGGRKKKRKGAGEARPEDQAADTNGGSITVPRAPPPVADGDNPLVTGSTGVAGDAIKWLLWPMSPKTFFEEYWERKPLHLKRANVDYYRGVFTKADLDQYLKIGSGSLSYGERLNLSRFDAELGKKVDLNCRARGELAQAEEVATAWDGGATIQVMHMQQFHQPLWRLLSSLERAFGALFGANSYITPKGCQGFAPHYDDVEVFMLQMEGAKQWRLWEPPDGEEFPLPREYSRDFRPEELGTPVLECLLEQGDLLYFPRGYVHAGITSASAGDGGAGPAFSHHLTVSTYQKMAWCQLLERALAGAMNRAVASSQELREGLPMGMLGYMGSWNDLGGGAAAAKGSGTSSTEGRAAFNRRFRTLLKTLQEYVDVDEVCDDIGVDFMSRRLPPAPPPASASATVASPAAPTEPTVTAESHVRWVDRSSVRAMLSTDPETSEATVMLFHSCGNARDGHMSRPLADEAEDEVGCLQFEVATFLPALRRMMDLAPGASIRCKDLPLADEGDRVALCENLLEAHVIELVKPEAVADATTPTVGNLGNF